MAPPRPTPAKPARRKRKPANDSGLLNWPARSLYLGWKGVATQFAVDHSFSTDRYWDDTGRGLTAGLIAHLATSEPASDRNPSAVDTARGVGEATTM